MLSKNLEYNEFTVPVIMNVTARPLTKKENLHEYLVRQITEKVRWRETIELIIQDSDINKIVEVAPGKILTKIITRANPGVNAFNIETVAQIEEFVRTAQ
jgi:[acyl-carrier-protein] S-malonyltransferase